MDRDITKQLRKIKTKDSSFISVFSNKNRVEILLFMLKKGPISVEEMQKSFTLTEQTMRKHIRILSDANLVKDGEDGLYRIEMEDERMRAIKELSKFSQKF